MKPENIHKSQYVVNTSIIVYVDLSYNGKIKIKVDFCSSRIIDIQAQMTERCIELLVLPEETPCLLLDIGCGSGLSGTVLEENGHLWIGLDISSAMLGMIIINILITDNILYHI